MTAPTHIAFGLLSVSGVFSFTATPLHRDLPALGCAMVGSLLPDIDTPGSTVGRALPFVSVPLERRWGHRTITHSFLALFSLAGLASPLFLYAWTLPLSFLVGYASHLIADCATKSGVPLFYPWHAICVFPASSRYRVHTGSLLGEGAVFLVLLLLLIAFMPVLRIGGIWRAVRYVLATPRSAYADYREATSETVLDFKGRWHDSREPVAGQAVILNGTPDWFLVAYREGLLLIGDEGDVFPDRLRVLQTSRAIQLQSLNVQKKALDEVLGLIPDSSVVSGHLESDVAFAPGIDVRALQGQQACIRVVGRELLFSFAPRASLQRLRPRRRVDRDRLFELRAQIGGLSSALNQMQLRRPPAHYLKIRKARDDLELARRELARLSDPKVRFTGHLTLRILGAQP